MNKLFKGKKTANKVLWFGGALILALIWSKGIDTAYNSIFPAFWGFNPSIAQEAIWALFLAPVLETLVYVWLPMQIIIHNKLDKANTLYGMVIAALLFAIVNHANDYYHMMVQGVGGFIMCYLYYKFRSFSFVAGFHACYNAIFLFFA